MRKLILLLCAVPSVALAQFGGGMSGGGGINAIDAPASGEVLSWSASGPQWVPASGQTSRFYYDDDDATSDAPTVDYALNCDESAEVGNGYIQADGSVWECQGGGWVDSGTSILGPSGTNGADGADGADGRTIYNGSGAPGVIAGEADGDLYIDTAADAYYVRSGGSWGAANSMVGSGDVTGPVGSTDNTLARFNGVGGDTLDDTTYTIGDDGRLSCTVNSEVGLVFSGTSTADYNASLVAGELALPHSDDDTVRRPMVSVGLIPAIIGGQGHAAFGGYMDLDSYTTDPGNGRVTGPGQINLELYSPDNTVATVDWGEEAPGIYLRRLGLTTGQTSMGSGAQAVSADMAIGDIVGECWVANDGTFSLCARMRMRAVTTTTSDPSALISFETSDGSSGADIVRRWDFTGPGHLVPFVDGTYDIGTTSNRVRDIHVDRIVFSDGTTMTTASGGGGGSTSITPAPTSIAYANTVQSTTRDETVTLTASAGDTINVSGVTFSGTDAARFSLVSPAAPFTVTDSGRVVTLRFSPNAVASFSANADFAHDATGTSTPLQVALSGDGVAAASSEIAAAPSPLAFGNVTTGGTSDLATTLTATNDTVNVTGLAISGADAARFAVQTPPTAATPIAISAGGTSDITVRCSPTVDGALTATLAVTHDAVGTASPLNVSLTCTGTTPSTYDPTTDFPNALDVFLAEGITTGPLDWNDAIDGTVDWATATGAPTVAAGGGPGGGRQTLTLDGVDDTLTMTEIPFAADDAYTIAGVVRPEGAAGDSGVVWSFNNNSPTIWLNNSGWEIYHVGLQNTGSIGSWTQNTWHYWILSYTGGAAGTLTLVVDGTEVFSGAAVGGSYTGGNGFLGTYTGADLLGEYSLDTLIYGSTAYSGWTAQQQSDLRGYLADRRDGI